MVTAKKAQPSFLAATAIGQARFEATRMKCTFMQVPAHVRTTGLARWWPHKGVSGACIEPAGCLTLTAVEPSYSVPEASEDKKHRKRAQQAVCKNDKRTHDHVFMGDAVYAVESMTMFAGGGLHCCPRRCHRRHSHLQNGGYTQTGSRGGMKGLHYSDSGRIVELCATPAIAAQPVVVLFSAQLPH